MNLLEIQTIPTLRVLNSRLMHEHNWLVQHLFQSRNLIHPIVPFDLNGPQVIALNLSKTNDEITDDVLKDAKSLSYYIQEKIQAASAILAMGGYAEIRAWPWTETRRHNRNFINLGVEIWSLQNTPVSAPFGGRIYALSYNKKSHGLGANIILQHHLGATRFFTSYGRLSAKSLQGKRAKQEIKAGEQIGEFGSKVENGGWLSHLHFQIILLGQEDPVFAPSLVPEQWADYYLTVCPDPCCLLKSTRLPEAYRNRLTRERR